MKRFILAAAVGTLAFAGIANARPFDQKNVSASAKWVVHVDVDAVAKSQTWKLVEPKLLENPEFQKAKKDIERIAQVRLPDDMHDVTIYGSSFGEKDAVIVIRSEANDERLKTLISLNETYTSKAHGDQTIHSWEDKGKQLHAGFATDRRVVIGQSPDSVVAALDVLAGKAASIRNDALTPTSTSAGILSYVAGDQIAQLVGTRADNRPRAAILQHLNNAWFVVTENDKGIHVTSRIVAADEKVALNVKQAVVGIQAMVSFAGQDDPDAMLAADALLDLKATSVGNQVDIEWQIPTRTISDILERAGDKIVK